MVAAETPTRYLAHLAQDWLRTDSGYVWTYRNHEVKKKQWAKRVRGHIRCFIINR